jgi:hypothetical protein
LAGERRAEEEIVAIAGGIQAGLDWIVIRDGNRVSEEEAARYPSDLDALDIERIEVQKGTRAVERYGPRAKRGVILLFLKQGDDVNHFRTHVR